MLCEATGDVGNTQLKLAGQDAALPPQGTRQRPLAGATAAPKGACAGIEARKEEYLESEQCARNTGAPKQQRGYLLWL
eukprot:2491922-Prymnesium_polylepis.1